MTFDPDLEKRIRDGFDGLINCESAKRIAWCSSLWSMYHSRSSTPDERKFFDRIIDEYASEYEKYAVTQPAARFFRYLEKYMATPVNPVSVAHHPEEEILALVREFLLKGRRDEVAAYLTSIKGNIMRGLISKTISTVKVEMHKELGAYDESDDDDELDDESEDRIERQALAQQALKNLEELQDSIDLREPFEGQSDPVETALPDLPDPVPDPEQATEPERPPDPQPKPEPPPETVPESETKPVPEPPPPPGDDDEPPPPPGDDDEPPPPPGDDDEPPPPPGDDDEPPSPPEDDDEPPLPPGEEDEPTDEQKKQQDKFKELYPDD